MFRSFNVEKYSIQFAIDIHHFVDTLDELKLYTHWFKMTNLLSIICTNVLRMASFLVFEVTIYKTKLHLNFDKWWLTKNSFRPVHFDSLSQNENEYISHSALPFVKMFNFHFSILNFKHTNCTRTYSCILHIHPNERYLLLNGMNDVKTRVDWMERKTSFDLLASIHSTFSCSSSYYILCILKFNYTSSNEFWLPLKSVYTQKRADSLFVILTFCVITFLIISSLLFLMFQKNFNYHFLAKSFWNLWKEAQCGKYISNKWIGFIHAKHLNILIKR